MDSSDPRMQLLQRWKDEGLLAKAGFIDAGYLDTLTKDERDVYRLPARPQEPKKEGEKGKRKKRNKKGKNSQTVTVAQLEWGMKHISGMSGMPNHKKGEKKKHENEYLKSEWTPDLLKTKKAVFLNMLSKAVMTALDDVQSKLTYPENFKDEVGLICPAIAKPFFETAKSKLDTFALELTGMHDHDEKGLNYKSIDLSKFTGKDDAVTQSALVSKLIFLLLKCIKKSKADDTAKGANPTKYDSADLRFMQKGLRFYSNQIRLIDEVLNPTAATPTVPPVQEPKKAAGPSLEVGSIADFGTGVFSMGRPYK